MVKVGVIFRLRETENSQFWAHISGLRRRYIHLNRYFPSVTDGHKWLKNAIFRWLLLSVRRPDCAQNLLSVRAGLIQKSIFSPAGVSG